MTADSSVDIQSLFRAEMVALALAPFLVTLGEYLLADAADAVAVPECHDKIHPFLVAVSTLRAGEQFVHTGKGLVGQRNEIVLQRYHRFHVEVVLAAAQLQLLSHSVHRSIFPQIHPVVKAVLGGLHGVCLVGLDLADRAAPALLDEQRIQDADINAVLMQCRRNRLMVAPGGLHDDAGIFPQCNDGVGHLLQTYFGMEKFLRQQRHFTHWPQGSHNAFSFGNIDPYCVHFAPPCDWIWLSALYSLPVQSPG